jgi:SAM-dependent methyltransferase
MPGLLSKYLSQKRAKMAKPYLKGHILDIGCGPARNLEILKINNLPYDSYTGIEYDKDQVKLLKTEYPDSDFFSVDLDSESLPFDKKFDTIILLAVIEHIFNLKFLFQQLEDHLSDNGQIVLTTPTVFGNDFVHKWGASLGFFDKQGGQDDHIVIFNKKRLQVLGEEVGLKLSYYKKFQFGCNQLAVFNQFKL